MKRSVTSNQPERGIPTESNRAKLEELNQG